METKHDTRYFREEGWVTAGLDRKQAVHELVLLAVSQGQVVEIVQQRKSKHCAYLVPKVHLRRVPLEKHVHHVLHSEVPRNELHCLG